MPAIHPRTPTPARSSAGRRRYAAIAGVLIAMALGAGASSSVTSAPSLWASAPSAGTSDAAATAARASDALEPRAAGNAEPAVSRSGSERGAWERWRCHRLFIRHLAAVRASHGQAAAGSETTGFKPFRCHRHHEGPRPTPTVPAPTDPTDPAPTTPTTPTPTDPTTSPEPPSSTVGCAADPSSCGYPDASNTGVPAGTDLVRVPEDVTSGKGWHYDSRGWIEVDQAGATLSGITTTRNVNVTADDVTVQNSRIIVAGNSFGVSVRHADNVTVRHNEIAGPRAFGPTRLMVGVKDIYSDAANLKVIGNDIWHTSTGVQMDQGLIQDNYIHDLGFTGDDHVNGTTSNGGSKPLTIRHNTIFNPHDQTDAISLFQDFGVQQNRVVDDNLLAGGGYTIYAGASRGAGSVATNIAITNNRISPLFYPRGGYFGYGTAYANGGGNSWSGNVWDDTGRPIPQP